MTRRTGLWRGMERGDDPDWPKRTWDLPPDIESAEDMRTFLAERGQSMEDFKQSAAYRLAVKHGKGPSWLEEL